MEKPMSELERKIAHKLIVDMGPAEGIEIDGIFLRVEQGDYEGAKEESRNLRFQRLYIDTFVDAMIYGRKRDPLADFFCRLTANSVPWITEDIELLIKGYINSRTENYEHPVKNNSSYQLPTKIKVLAAAG